MKPRIRRIIIIKSWQEDGQQFWLACRLTESRDVKLVRDLLASGQKITCLKWSNQRPKTTFKILAFFSRENYQVFEVIGNLLFDGQCWYRLNNKGVGLNDFIERARAENRLLKELPPHLLSTSS